MWRAKHRGRPRAGPSFLDFLVILMIWAGLGVYFAMVALDFTWAHYTAAIAAKQSVRAALWAAATILFTGTAAIGYTSQHWLLIPAMLGAISGTWLAVDGRALTWVRECVSSFGSGATPETTIVEDD
jgi:hypothetical protein